MTGRVLYVENDTVYAILADVLPNSTGHAERAGFTTTGEFGISITSFSKDLTDSFLSKFDSSVFNELGNGFATKVRGTVTQELLVNSYNFKYNETLQCSSSTKFNNDLEGVDLYLNGFSYYIDKAYVVDKAGYVPMVMTSGGLLDYTGTGYGIRPVAELPSTTKANLENGVWKLSK